MTLNEAKEQLKDAIRYECRDHAFGDREVYWEKVPFGEIASGYFSATVSEVSVGGFGFVGADARALLDCGTLQVARNDSTGPSEYRKGVGLGWIRFYLALSLRLMWSSLGGENERNSLDVCRNNRYTVGNVCASVYPSL